MKKIERLQTLLQARPALALPILVGLAIVLRWFSFSFTVIDHDESTYIVIAQGLLQGKTYLLDLIDTKPIGIFLVYAGLIQLSGGSIFGMRLLTAVVVGLTAYLLYRQGRRATGSDAVGWAAGIAYLFISSIFSRIGIPPNTELFFVPLAVGAIALAWDAGNRVGRYLGAGLLLGLGFVIKYVVAADAFALGLFLLLPGLRRGEWLATIVYRCLPLTLAFFLPILAVYGYYQQLGATEAFWFYTLEVTGRYPVRSTVVEKIVFLLDFYGRFFPWTLLAILASGEPLAADRSWQRFCWLWLGCTSIMVLLPGKLFNHYHIQLMAPLSALAATFFHPARQRWPWLRGWPPVRTYAVVGGLFLLITTLHALNFGRKEDAPAEIADFLRPRLEAGDRIYTGDFHQILYYLLDRDPPTAYVHGSLLFEESHQHALNIDLPAEAHAIMQLAPRYVLLYEQHKLTALTDSIDHYYQLVHTFPYARPVQLYERKAEPETTAQ